MSELVLGQLKAACAITHLILRNRAAEFGVPMDCGGWVDSARLVEALGQIGAPTKEVIRWLVATHERFRETFRSPGAVLLVVLTRLDHEGALEVS
eukprot:5130626-Alexandrium_andersonii.AAC.1